MNVVVLGAGMVGKAIVYDLSKKYKVTAVDVDRTALDFCREKYEVDTIVADLSDTREVKKIIKETDFVVSAVPGFMGFDTLKAVIEEGKNVVDISFMPEDFMELDELAQAKNVVAVADCGVAPGMPNIIVGHYAQKYNISNFEYYVGGLPKERAFPFEYKAPFSPIDVIEEYTRPARAKMNNQIIENPAMSDPELFYFKGLGHLEGFNTDGLRSLLHTMNIPNMKEKTLRYPGHIKLVSSLIAAGFFSDKPIELEGNEIKPVDFTNKVLFNNWKLEPNDEEFTVMRVILDAEIENRNQKVIYDLFDEFDKETSISSMARTTGYTATAAVNLITERLYYKAGVHPPEHLGEKGRNFQFILKYLQNRGVEYKKSTVEM